MSDSDRVNIGSDPQGDHEPIEPGSVREVLSQSAISGKDDQSIDDDYPKYKECWPGMEIGGSRVEHLVLYTRKFFVVILKSKQYWYELRWDTPSGDGDGETATSVQKNENALNRAEILQSLPLGHLSNEECFTFLRMVAQGVVSALQNQADNAENILNQAESYRIERSQDRAARLAVNFSSVTSAAAICGILLVGRVGQNFAESPLSWSFLQAVMAGVCGAFFFSLISRQRNRFDSEASTETHATDAAVRVAVGGLAAGVAYSAIRSQAILGFLNSAKSDEAAHMLTLLTCFVSGYSERFVTNIISMVESPQSATKPNPAP